MGGRDLIKRSFIGNKQIIEYQKEVDDQYFAVAKSALKNQSQRSNSREMANKFKRSGSSINLGKGYPTLTGE